MDSTADHEFNSKIASQALLKAATELSERTGQPLEELDGKRMGDLYELAVATFANDLPDFWVVWNGWNTASDDHAPWGEL